MKKVLPIALACVFGVPISAPAAEFEDYARVLSVSERIDRYNQPRQECYTDELTGETAETGERGVAGAVLGGLTGALLGRQVGRGDGQVAATAVGAAAGAIVGDRMQNGGGAAARPVQRCRTVDNYVTKVIGYTVTYEYQGTTHTENVQFNPGDSMRVRVRLVPLRGSNT